MEKAAVFVDGGYLNRVLKQLDKHDVDYLSMSNGICKEVGTTRLRTYYYHCKPVLRKGNEEDTKRHSNMQMFLTKLKRLPRFEVKLGRLQLIGGQFKQKMVDVLMSLDIVDMCFAKQIQHAVLVAGDSDFVPAVKKAKDHGAIVHLYYYPKSVHNALLDEVDELHVISQETVSKWKR